MDPELLRERVAPVVLGLGVGIPALIVAGFMPAWNVLPLVGWAAIAAIAGAVGGALMAERGRGVAAAMGLLGAPASIAAIVAYTQARAALSSTYLSIEFLIPVGIVVAPLVWLHVRLYPPSGPGPG